jgi:hypothetical protein
MCEDPSSANDVLKSLGGPSGRIVGRSDKEDIPWPDRER